jgi:hypothetical protein
MGRRSNVAPERSQFPASTSRTVTKRSQSGPGTPAGLFPANGRWPMKDGQWGEWVGNEATITLPDLPISSIYSLPIVQRRFTGRGNPRMPERSQFGPSNPGVTERSQFPASSSRHATERSQFDALRLPEPTAMDIGMTIGLVKLDDLGGRGKAQRVPEAAPPPGHAALCPGHPPERSQFPTSTSLAHRNEANFRSRPPDTRRNEANFAPGTPRSPERSQFRPNVRPVFGFRFGAGGGAMVRLQFVQGHPSVTGFGTRGRGVGRSGSVPERRSLGRPGGFG